MKIENVVADLLWLIVTKTLLWKTLKDNKDLGGRGYAPTGEDYETSEISYV